VCCPDESQLGAYPERYVLTVAYRGYLIAYVSCMQVWILLRLRADAARLRLARRSKLPAGLLPKATEHMNHPHNSHPTQSSPDKLAPEPPAHWEADVVAADGGVVHVRPIRPSDADKLVAFHATLSERTRYLRFFAAHPTLSEQDLARFTQMDYRDRVGLVVLLGLEIIGVGRYARLSAREGEPSAPEAEVAFVVTDAHQGRGIGSMLLEHLAAAGRESGIQRFQASVLAENGAMLRVFRDAGYAVTRHSDGGEVTLEFALDETALTEAVSHEREQRSEARSIARLLSPKSIAVIGASNDPSKIGHAVFRSLLSANFNGPLYPVNPRAQHVCAVSAYKSITDIPHDVDLTVVAVPANVAFGVVEQCAAKGVHGIVLISGGFGETGDARERALGAQKQAELVQLARAHGLRIVGPNCFGIINTAPDVLLNASLSPVLPTRGRVGFFCQSGALGVALIDEAARRNIGLSTFVSAGNRADVSGNDVLQYWTTDDTTQVVLMYLESFGNPRKFARLSRRLARIKPIITVNSGARAVAPGLMATSAPLSEEVTQALLFRSGVIRTETVSGMFDVALLAMSQPLPRGNRIAIVGNSAALEVLVANACAAVNLTVTQRHDVGVDGTALAYENALSAALAAEDVDAVIAVFAPVLPPARAEDVAAVLQHCAHNSNKPVLSTFLGLAGVPSQLTAAGDVQPAPGSIPSFPSPERAARALGRMVRYAAWRHKPAGELPVLHDVNLDTARDSVASVLNETPEGRQLTAAEAGRLAACAGLQVSAGNPAADAVEVVVAVREHPAFGALLSFGLAGLTTELLADRAYAIVPLTTQDADELVLSPRAAPLLTGYRDATPVDLRALTEVVLRLSTLSDALPELAECSLAVQATPTAAHVTCVSARITKGPTRVDTGPRRMRGL